MTPSYDRYWESLWSRTPFRRALLASLLVHLGVVVALVFRPEKPPAPAVMVAYDVEVISEANEIAEAPAEEPPPPDPEPEPPEPEPEPEPEPPPPPPEPEPEPEPPAPEPEPEPVVEKPPPPEPKPEPKPVEKKPEPKEEPKPEPPPKKVAKATPELKEAEPKPELRPAEPKPEQRPAAPAKTGAHLKQALPSELAGWARQVRRKVDGMWTAPGGMRVSTDGSEAVISFWVNRQGQLIGRPEVVKHGSDPALAESGIAALIAANPLPPLPEFYSAQEQQVVYAFSVTD